MKVEIELIEGESTAIKWSGWKVTLGDKYADGLGYDEMLGLVAAITIPVERPAMQWLKTEAEWEAWRERINNSKVDIEFDPIISNL